MDLDYPECAQLAQKVSDLEIYNHVANALAAHINHFVSSFEGEPLQHNIAQSLADALEPWAIKIIQEQVPHPDLVQFDNVVHDHPLPEDAHPTPEPREINSHSLNDHSGSFDNICTPSNNNLSVRQSIQSNTESMHEPVFSTTTTNNSPAANCHHPSSTNTNQPPPALQSNDDQENIPPSRQPQDPNGVLDGNNSKRKRDDETTTSVPPSRPNKRPMHHALGPKNITNTNANTNDDLGRKKNGNKTSTAPIKPRNTTRPANLSSFAAPTQASSERKRAAAPTSVNQRGDTSRPVKRVRAFR